MDDWEKLCGTSLHEKEDIYSQLNIEDITVLLHQDKTKVRLDFITDIDMLLLVKKGIRGGI